MEWSSGPVAVVIVFAVGFAVVRGLYLMDEHGPPWLGRTVTGIVVGLVFVIPIGLTVLDSAGVINILDSSHAGCVADWCR